MKFLSFIVLLFFFMVTTGCRCHRTTTVQTDHSATELIEVNFRRLYSLLTTSSERQTIRIEYYPANFSLAADSAVSTPVPCGGSAGSIKSIEITNENSTTTQEVHRSDSTAVIDRSEEDHNQKASDTETRQAGGTVIGIVIVLAVALLFYEAVKIAIKS